MSECTHDCSTCKSGCAEKPKPESLLKAPHPASSIKKVIGVVSGKGGVGKSMTSAMLATLMARREYKVGLLDADITGPSAPRLFGLKTRAISDENAIYPVETKTGIDVMSVNLLLQNESDPVVWRGPVIAGTVTQFWQDVLWQDIDFLFIDMPPGTGDVPLTVFQSIPLDGIVVVASPQELVQLIVEKAVNMAKMMQIPVLGLVENMSYLACPDCGKKLEPFGKSRAEETAKLYGMPLLAKIPIDPALALLADKGAIEAFEGDFLDKAADAVEALL